MHTKTQQLLQDSFGIRNDVVMFCEKAENMITAFHKQTDEICAHNQAKVLYAMQKNHLSEIHFAATTGYGYNDLGRDTLEAIYADTFHTEAALVRPQMVSGTHAISTALFGNLRHGDELVAITGTPYDTLQAVIGIRETKGSLIEHGIVYKQVDLLENGQVNFSGIEKTVSSKTKMVAIQRSKGYGWRHSFTVSEIAQMISFVKNINSNIICFVDNCYGEFVDFDEPTDHGADLMAGSLIKNPGGGLAPVGGYIVGKEELIENAGFRLTTPGMGREVGPTLGMSAPFLQGFFLAPQVVAASVKGAILASQMFQTLGYSVLPSPQEKRSDIVQAICLHSEEAVVAFCQGVQKGAAVDHFVAPIPWDMPGYGCKVIMAAGAFVQGSSIELSADAPIREPYNVFLQGGLTYDHAKLGIIIALNEMAHKGLVKL